MAVDGFESDFGVDEILQAEPEHMPAMPIPVDIHGPVHTRPLSARNAGLRSYTLSTTTPIKIAGHDPRRKRMVLYAVDFTGTSHGVRLGNSRAEVEAGSFPFLLGVFQVGGTTATSQTLEITSMDEIWALADTAACTLSVASESWV